MTSELLRSAFRPGSRSRSTKALRLLHAAALCMATTPAFAQPPPSGADPSQEADGHFLAAKARIQAGDLRGAYDEYKAAWTLKKTYDTATNLGTLEMKLGMPRDAAEHLAFALRNYAVTGVTQDKLELMKQALARARAEVGSVTVKVDLPDAEIVVDGKVVGRSPLEDEVFVDPGSRTIGARISGRESPSETISATRGSTQTVTLRLADSSRGPGWVWIIATGALGVGGFAAGAGLLVAAGNKGSTASALSSGGNSSTCAGVTSAMCTNLANAASSKTTLSNAATGVLIAGGAFTVVALALGTWKAVASQDAPKAARLVPMVGPNGGGLVLVGAW